MQKMKNVVLGKKGCRADGGRRRWLLRCNNTPQCFKLYTVIAWEATVQGKGLGCEN